MIVRRILVWAAALPLAILVAIGIAAGVGVQYAYEPAPDKVLSRNRTSPQAFMGARPLQRTRPTDY